MLSLTIIERRVPACPAPKLRQIESHIHNRRLRRLPPEDCPSRMPVGKRGYKITVRKAILEDSSIGSAASTSVAA